MRGGTLHGLPPVVIAHRGASGLLPEHTLAAYRLAIDQGADFIEPDLVCTRDGVPVCRHEPGLSRTTDVAAHARFAARRRTLEIDGASVTDWFVFDFTLGELRELRAVQAFAERPREHDGLHAVPTLDEVLDLVRADIAVDALAGGSGAAPDAAPVGVYIELKHPSLHRALGLPLEEALLDALAARGMTAGHSPVVLQCFEPSCLQRLARRTDVRRVQLVGGGPLADDGRVTLAFPDDRPWDFTLAHDAHNWADMLSDEGLAMVRDHAHGIGPWKRWLLPTRRDVALPFADERGRRALPATDLVDRAHRAGLFVHAYTFRNDPRFLPAGCTPGDELRAAFDAGVDGVFTDFPSTAVGVLSRGA